MEEPTQQPGPSEPALTPVNQAVQYAGGPLSLDDVAGMIRSAADYSAIPLTDRQCRQLAGSPLAAAKAHGNYRYGLGYAHGRGDFEREGTLPNLDDPRDVQVDLMAKAIREASDGVPMSAEEWAEVLFDSGVRAIDPTGAVRPWSWRRTAEGWTSSPAPDPMRCIICGGQEADGLVSHAPGCARVLSSGGLDTSSSASRQHYIDTGRYLVNDDTVGRCQACGEECDAAEDVCRCPDDCPIPAAASNR